jgi:hypothetical protein
MQVSSVASSRLGFENQRDVLRLDAAALREELIVVRPPA